MTTKKEFDCIEYKRAIQAKHAAETQSLSPEEKMKHRSRWLAESDNQAARLWRELCSRQAAAARSR
jgi:hypothetical protein